MADRSPAASQVRAPDAVVIGAGVIGCSVAHELARDGLAVLVLDRGPGAGHGSTSASSAIIRFTYSTYTGVAVSWEAKHVWEGWRDHLDGDDDGRLARFHRTGSLVLDSPDIDRSRMLALFEEVGVPYEVWDAATVRARLPAVDPGRHHPPKPVDDEAFWADPDGEVGGFWTPDAGFVDDPTFAAHNLMVAARRRGARFRFRAEVHGIRRSGDRVAGVDLADGERIDCPVVVNVAGPHSAHVNGLAGALDDFTITTRPLRQEVHQLPAPPGYSDAGPGPMVADLDLGTYFRGTPAGGLIVGGTEPACDPLHWLDDADDYSPTVTAATYRSQVYRAARRLPELTVPNTPRGIVGIYDVTQDWIPVYDRTALPGYYVAIGTSGNQFKNAPLVGRFLAEIIAACESGRDHDRTPVQVTLPHTGLTVDLAHYRRKRPVHEDSSFTVMG
jgi:sarcosine oxidase subunit beta